MQSIRRALKRVLSTTNIATDDAVSQNKHNKRSKTQHHDAIYEEMFNTVLSQGSESNVTHTSAADADCDSEMDSQDFQDVMQEETEDVCTDHAEHCNIRAEMCKLLAIIQIQKQYIDQLDAKINTVMLYVGLHTDAGASNESHRGPASVGATAAAAADRSRQTTTSAAAVTQQSWRKVNRGRRNRSSKTTQQAATLNHTAGRYVEKSRSAGEHTNSTGSTDVRHTTMIIQRTINDISRRKQNVIVSGLPENELVDDQVVFTELCSIDLSIKPSIASCSRIGTAVTGRPRRLLVRLGSEETASALLRAAPELRQSEDLYTSTSVFINPDLSPTAAKLAYEQRRRRREAREAREAREHEEYENYEQDAPTSAASTGDQVRMAVDLPPEDSHSKTVPPSAQTAPTDSNTITVAVEVHKHVDQSTTLTSPNNDGRPDNQPHQ